MFCVTLLAGHTDDSEDGSEFKAGTSSTTSTESSDVSLDDSADGKEYEEPQIGQIPAAASVEVREVQCKEKETHLGSAPVVPVAPDTPDDDVIIVGPPEKPATKQSVLSNFFVKVAPPPRGVPCPVVVQPAPAPEITGVPANGKKSLREVISLHKRTAVTNAVKAGLIKRRRIQSVSKPCTTAPST